MTNTEDPFAERFPDRMLDGADFYDMLREVLHEISAELQLNALVETAPQLGALLEANSLQNPGQMQEINSTGKYLLSMNAHLAEVAGHLQKLLERPEVNSQMTELAERIVANHEDRRRFQLGTVWCRNRV